MVSSFFTELGLDNCMQTDEHMLRDPFNILIGS